MFIRFTFLVIFTSAFWPVAPLHASDGFSIGQSSFSVFESTAYQDKTDFVRHGIKYVEIIAHDLWENRREHEGLPQRERVKAAVESRKDDSFVIFDIESWPMSGSAEISASVRKYQTIAKWSREAAPDLHIGFYAIPPIRDYWRAIQPEDDPRKRAWKEENNKTKALAGQLDILFPSLYTFYDDPEGWRRYAVENIKEARRLNPKKPIYPFLWPEFHDSNKKLKGTFVSGDFWRLQLETVARHADGVVIWGGWGENGPRQWDPNADWWVATVHFLESMHNSHNRNIEAIK